MEARDTQTDYSAMPLFSLLRTNFLVLKCKQTDQVKNCDDNIYQEGW
jgi:hypothetical protein